MSADTGALVPEPTRPVDPLVEVWPAGAPLHRIFGSDLLPLTFSDPGPARRSRFAWLDVPAAGVLYLGESDEAVVAETLLHDVPLRGGRLLPERYQDRIAARVVPSRDLRLAQLHSGGLRRLGIRAEQLTDTTAAHYERTASWAGAVHGDTDLDGLVWMSRQWNSARCILLFGDRVAAGELAVDASVWRMFGANPDDFEWLAGLCQEVGIVVVPPG